MTDIDHPFGRYLAAFEARGGPSLCVVRYELQDGSGFGIMIDGLGIAMTARQGVPEAFSGLIPLAQENGAWVFVGIDNEELEMDTLGTTGPQPEDQARLQAWLVSLGFAEISRTPHAYGTLIGIDARPAPAAAIRQ